MPWVGREGKTVGSAGLLTITLFAKWAGTDAARERVWYGCRGGGEVVVTLGECVGGVVGTLGDVAGVDAGTLGEVPVGSRR